MLYDDYCKTLQDVRGLHGERSIVLIEVGSFFELYAVTDAEVLETRMGLPESCMRSVCDLLEIQMTKKNKAVSLVNRSNPFMAGFPSFMMDKYMDILVSAGYTVAVMEQKKSRCLGTKDKQKEIYRTLTRVESPGTYMPSSSFHHGNRYTMAIYLYCSKSRATGKTNLASFGTAVADFTTGESFIYEMNHAMDDIDRDHRIIREDMYRIVLAFRPIEVIIIGTDTDDQLTQNIISYLDLDCAACVHAISNEHIVKTYKKASYQNAMLGKVFKDRCKDTMLSPLEIFDLERRPCAATALCALLQFAHDHGEHVTRKIKPPGLTHDSITNACTLLNYNSAVQLDIVENKGDNKKSFIGLFNKCVTPMGRRLFKSRLLAPVYSPSVINDRLDKVAFAIKQDPLRIRKEYLEGMCDAPRLLRKVVMNNIDHAGIWRLHAFVSSGLACLSTFDKDKQSTQVQEFLCYVEETFTEPASKEYTSHQVSFKCLSIDIGIINDSIAHIEKLVCRLNTNAERYKIDSTDRDGFFITVTSKRHKEALSEEDLASELVAAGPASTGKSTSLRFTHDIIRNANKAIAESRERIQEQTKILMASACDKIVADYHDYLSDLSSQIADIDVACNVAMLAIDNAWVRPAIIDNEHILDNNNDEQRTRIKPYVIAQGLRHPIVENVLTKHAYVPNDVRLGLSGTDGMLLFGINASGKSSLMKSVGLSVIMAQAGMYVAAETLTLCPYKSIYTRIAAGDNLFAGRSTFTSEILELRNILKAANEDSLVIGDELCAGTESSSATAIVAAGIERLSQVGSTFLLATHLHELTRMGLVDNIANLVVYHLDVRYDETNETIIYDRKLVPGPGDALYGLEVCKALDMDKEFVRSASMIRNKLLGVHNEIISTKESRYNAQVFMDTCQICKKTMSVETHHMVPQSMADDNGIVLGRYHKNKEYNLLCVCQTCHDRIHSDNDICSYVMSTKGYIIKSSD